MVGLVLSELLLVAALGLHWLLAAGTAWSLRGCEKPVGLGVWMWLPVVWLLAVGVWHHRVFFEDGSKRRFAAGVVVVVAVVTMGMSYTAATRIDAGMARACE